MSAPILTTSGWSTFGDLRVGDQVYTHDGSATQVVGMTEPFVRPVNYRVTFADNQEVICTPEHEWTVNVRWKGTKTLETQEMAEDCSVFEGWSVVGGKRYPRYRHKYSVITPGALDIPTTNLPIPPYTFGYWLGNGTRGHGGMSTHADDTYDVVRAVRKEGFEVGTVTIHEDRTVGVFVALGLIQHLRAMGVDRDKSVPEEYVLSSRHQRLAFLRGLMDSDGSVERKGRSCEFSSMDRHLAEAVTFLVRSLGAKTSGVKTGRAKLNGIDCGEKYRVLFVPPFNPFGAARKRNAFTPRKGTRSSTNAIVRIEQVPTEPMRCIQVADPSGIYLTGPGLIPTHNSWMSLNIAVCITHELKVFGAMESDCGDVLYLALEDQQRRLKSRYEQMTAKVGHKGAGRFSMAISAPRLTQGGEEFIEKWVKNADHPRLVIVDTIGKIRPRKGRTDDMYADSYDDMGILKSLADDLGIGVLGIHHTRKSIAEDALQEVLGSTGLTGAADSIWVLKRKRGDNNAFLLITGRDIEECSMSVCFDPEDGTWKGGESGNYQHQQHSRDAILDWAVLHMEDHKTFTPGLISESIGMSLDAARMGVIRITRLGQFVRVRNGVYRLSSTGEGPTMKMNLEEGSEETEL